MYAQCDRDGNEFVLMVLIDAITDHKKMKDAVSEDDRYLTVGGRQHPRKTTRGWKLCVLWKDGTTSWERLADMKESYPVEVAEYAVTQGIQDEPAFSWWTPQVLRRRDRIICCLLYTSPSPRDGATSRMPSSA